MGLSVEPVTRKSRSVKRIYEESFPKEERMPFWLMLLLSKTKSTDYLSFYMNDTICGFVYLAAVGRIVFIMFLAVDEKLRSKGYGSRILDEIQSLYPGHKLIVSIERCDVDTQDQEQRVRRKEFYRKNGYRQTGYLLELSRVKQEILIKNGEFDKSEFLSFFRKYSNGTLKPAIWEARAE